MAEIKLYDERDYDYYNPKPYLQKLVNILLKSVEVQNNVAYDIDDKSYDYLFVYQTKEDAERERKKNRVFHSDFVNRIKIEHADRVRYALENGVGRFIMNLKNNIEKRKEQIRDLEKIIANGQIGLEEQKKELKELEDVIEKYKSKDKTGTPEIPF
jgi:phage pi2 protein 07